MKAMMTAALLITLHACTDSDDPAEPQQAELQQAEIIEVHGCSPGWIDDGYRCIDPWHGGGWGPGPGDVGGPERVPGGGRGGGGGADGGGDPAPASKWTCDASCNVQQAKPGARCPDRVTGRGTGTSSESACAAAKQDANSKVPTGCYKRHCHCSCTKGNETVIDDDDDPILTVTHE
jgi:hypothetical protein